MLYRKLPKGEEEISILGIGTSSMPKKHAIINLGGNSQTAGTKPDGNLWKIIKAISSFSLDDADGDID